FPRNFTETRTLKGVEEKLPDIADLGANALWLMPVHPVSEERRKGAEGSPYSVHDFRAVDASLGSIDDLAALTAAAHARGMKVLLDFVPDHSAWDHAAVKEYPNWFMKDEQGRLRPPVPAWDDVVQFNYGNPAVRAEMQAVMYFWPSRCGIDGYRVDVAGMVPGEFWKEAIPPLRAAVTGLVMLAEATGPDYHEQGFDLSYDMDLRNRLWDVAHGKQPASALAEHLEYVRDHYRRGALLMRYTENHDIDRTAASFAKPSDRTAAALIFSLPGVPLILAGQEVGVARRADLFVKDLVPWRDGDATLRDFYKGLIDARRKHPSLRHGSLVIRKTDQPDRVLAFTRESDEETMLALFNFSGEPAEVRVADFEAAGTVQLAPWSYVLRAL
ncbi:MAG TPA: alpha-amylase family glycosyl hydrolase, partial [Kiritimatiellia bacterium]